MAMKITAGIGRKLGLPGYSMRSASCHVEFEAEQNLLGDPIAFRQRVSAAFAACREAVAEELARQKAEPTGNGTGQAAANGSSQDRHSPATQCRSRNGNGHQERRQRACCQRQTTRFRPAARQGDPRPGRPSPGKPGPEEALPPFVQRLPRWTYPSTMACFSRSEETAGGR